jgi:hypothetical protein
MLFNGRNSTCEATLNFENPMLLPISWIVVPKSCAGDQKVTFDVPDAAPNGTVLLTWYVPSAAQAQRD